MAILDKLQDSLRRRDVYVNNSDRWGDPRIKMLDSTEWQSHRVQVCRSLGHSVDGKEAIHRLTQHLDTTYRNVAANFEVNDAVRVDNTGFRPTLTITNLEKEEEPDSLVELRELVGNLLPKVDLTEIVLEINALTGFADEF